MQRLNGYEFTVNLASKLMVGEHLGHHERVLAADPRTAYSLIQQYYGSDLLTIKSGPVQIVSNALAADTLSGGGGYSASGSPLLSASSSMMPLMPSAKIAATFNQPTVNGDNDLYTVPAGKRAFIFFTLYNQSGSSLNFKGQFKIGGTTYPVTVSTAVANNGSSGVIPFNGMPIAEPGDTISINTTGIMRLFGGVVTFDVADGISSPRLINFQVGDNTLYTCPAGKNAFATNFSDAGNAPIRTVNNSPGLRTYKLRCVPSGQTPADTYLIAPQFTTAVGVSTNTAIATCLVLGPGDFINLNVDDPSAIQYAYVLNMVEVSQ